jgi:hypothetical protein
VDKAPRTTRNISIGLIVLVLLSGCETMQRWLPGLQRSEPAEPIILGAPAANSYLTELHRLAEGDPVTQAEIFADAESAATLAPGTQTQLRYALILAAAGHGGSDPVRAQSLLYELLAEPELMTPAENALATIFLKDVEARIVLDMEARRLRAEYQRAASTEEAAAARRISLIETENRQLRDSLAEAEAKLEAITSIERSIREQAGENETQ